MAGTVEKKPLPHYKDPPVVESVLGVQFDRLSGFKNAHLGAFWKTLDTDEWSDVADAPMLPPQFERFTEAARWAKGVQFQFTQVPSSRLQIKNQDGDRMIQVQDGRLHFNWLSKGGRDYPRYEALRDGFSWVLDRFIKFIAQEDNWTFQPNQWEVTYVNHIQQGSVWRTPGDWGFFRLLGSIPCIGDIIEAESFGGEWHFVIPGQRGRLHIQWQHGQQPSSDQGDCEVLRLTLTARGPLEKDSSTQAVLDGLDLGRETIVRAFESVMSQDANKYWGLIYAKD